MNQPIVYRDLNGGGQEVVQRPDSAASPAAAPAAAAPEVVPDPLSSFTDLTSGIQNTQDIEERLATPVVREEESAPDDDEQLFDEATTEDETLEFEEQETSHPRAQGLDPQLQEYLDRMAADNQRMQTQLQQMLARDQAKEAQERHRTRLSTYEKELADARKALVDAEEANDTEAKINAQMKLAEASGRLETVKAAPPPQVPELSSETATDPATQQQQQQQQPQQPPQQSALPQEVRVKATAYQRANSWIGDPRYASANRVLDQVDQALSMEGYDPSKREYYVELSRRMQKANATQQLNIIVRAPRKGARRDTVTEERMGGGRLPPGGGNPARATLTAADKKDMLFVNLDPNNPVHAKRFLAERTKRESLESQMTRRDVG